MPELSYVPTFHHDDWIDRVTRVVAGGPDGDAKPVGKAHRIVEMPPVEDDLPRITFVGLQVGYPLVGTAEGLLTRRPGRKKAQVATIGATLRHDVPIVRLGVAPHFTGALSLNLNDQGDRMAQP